jgi:hypothetical protein
MQFHTESQYDPAQDRRAGRTATARVGGVRIRAGSLRWWRLVRTTVPARREGAVVQVSTTGGDGKPSYTVRTDLPDFGVTISKLLR